MLYLLWGKNDFLIFEKKKEIKRNFLNKFPNGLVCSKNSQEDNPSDFFSLCQKRDIFGSKKLIFFEDFSDFFEEKETKEFLKKNLSLLKNDSDIFIVFLENKEKNKFISFCLKEKIKNYFFKPFSEKEKLLLSKTIVDLAKKKGGEIDIRAANLLIDLVGYNGWQIKNELEKLIILSKGKKISQETIYKYCQFFFLSKEIFFLAEKLIEKNKKESCLFLNKLLCLGEEPSRVFNLLLKQLRNFFFIKFLPPKELNFKPFYINKTKNKMRDYNLREILKIYRQMSLEDFYLKTSLKEHKDVLFDFLRTL